MDNRSSRAAGMFFARAWVFWICLVLSCHHLYAQRKDSAFTLTGTINADTGTVTLMPRFDRAYYPHGLFWQETRVINGHFVFSGFVPQPTEFRLGFKINSELKSYSDDFILDPGIQTVFFNADSYRAAPEISNNSMKELNAVYVPFFSSFNLEYDALGYKYDSLMKVYNKAIPAKESGELQEERNQLGYKRKALLLAYTKEHPDSYVTLLGLVREIERGYERVVDSIYAQLSERMKNSFAGRILNEKIYTARNIASGDIFPTLNLLNEKNEKVAAPEISGASQYTLIDFWFSHCGACIDQFGDLKTIYTTNHAKGFEMIGISIDGPEYVGAWKKAIKKYKLPWKQCLDLSGKNAEMLSVRGCPANFLLDKKGEIIAKDILPRDLDSFLAKNLR